MLLGGFRPPSPWPVVLARGRSPGTPRTPSPDPPEGGTSVLPGGGRGLDRACRVGRDWLVVLLGVLTLTLTSWSSGRQWCGPPISFR